MGCPDFWDTPLTIFASVNLIVELKTNKSYGWTFLNVRVNGCDVNHAQWPLRRQPPLALHRGVPFNM